MYRYIPWAYDESLPVHNMRGTRISGVTKIPKIPYATSCKFGIRILDRVDGVWVCVGLCTGRVRTDARETMSAVVWPRVTGTQNALVHFFLHGFPRGWRETLRGGWEAEGKTVMSSAHSG